MKIKIFLQSWSSIITNSSSETFCVISSEDKETIKVVTDYLNSFLPYKVNYVDSDKTTYSIWFTINYGEDSHEIGCNMYSLIKKLLEEHFPGNNNFVVENGDDYN